MEKPFKPPSHNNFKNYQILQHQMLTILGEESSKSNWIACSQIASQKQCGDKEINKQR
jgi:hypothetical protein